ncbi:hypothetical protein NDU88_001201, partial [Pleurodeles waltl]
RGVCCFVSREEGGGTGGEYYAAILGHTERRGRSRYRSRESRTQDCGACITA